jgi:hypothetical protein
MVRPCVKRKRGSPSQAGGAGSGGWTRGLEKGWPGRLKLTRRKMVGGEGLGW